MQLNVEISQETFEKLKKQARKAGVAVETVAGNTLAESVVGSSASGGVAHSRWNKDGEPWSMISADDIAACYREAYAAKPSDADEFAWHEDDVSGFEERL